jgi:hypothetical protein
MQCQSRHRAVNRTWHSCEQSAGTVLVYNCHRTVHCAECALEHLKNFPDGTFKVEHKCDA